MSNTNLDTIKANIKAAFLHLCGLDSDRARTQNGIGWSGTHSRNAHDASRTIDTWSNNNFRYWANALVRYKRQLTAAGFEMSTLVWPDTATKKIDLRNNSFTIKFEDISKAEFAQILATVRALPQRRFDGASKLWLADNTASNQAAIQALAEKFGFEITEHAQTLLDQTETSEQTAQTVQPSNSNKLEKVGKVWRVSFAFDWAIVNAIKALPANIYKKWQPTLTGKPWDVAPCAELLVIAQKFNFDGAELLQAELGDIPPTEEKEQRAPIAQALSSEQLTRFEDVRQKLLPYQAQAVQNLATALLHGGALDASDTGTGKTYTAIAACAVLNKPIYVVCPKPVKTSWQRAAAHFGLSIQACSYELLRRGKQTECRLEKVKTTNGESDKFVWNLPANTVIIFDECHRLKDYRTLQCQLGINALEQGFTVLGLSATAADNPLQMKFAAMLTGQISTEKAFWGWACSHGVSKGRFGYEFNGSRAMLNQIHHAIFPARGNRVRIADLGDAFPQTQIMAECYDLNGETAEINRIYAEMDAQLAELEERMKHDKLGSQGEHLVIRLRARQKVELLKVPALAEMASDAMDSGLSVAVFLNFDESINALCEKLKTTCTIRGGQSETIRQANIDAFNVDHEPVIIANIRAGGVGVSLHGNVNSRTRLALISPSDSGQDLKQAFGRVSRAEGAKSLQRVVFAANTIEEEVCANVRAKISRIDTLNDGDLAISKIF